MRRVKGKRREKVEQKPNNLVAEGNLAFLT